MAIWIGTSGWVYRHWKGRFYPENITTKKWLDYYAGRFASVELNNSFYHLPETRTLKNWKTTVPDSFLFSVKASRYFTHMKKLKVTRGSVRQFFSRMKALNGKMGPVLFQLPPKWKPNPERLEAFLKILPKQYRYTFEFRNTGWFSKEIKKILEKYKAAFCIYELAGQCSPEWTTAHFVYVRLHGPGNKYQGDYDGQTLSRWARRIRAWHKQRKDVYLYFDNDDSAYAALNAETLQKKLKSVIPR